MMENKKNIAIRVKNLSVSYDRKRVLTNIFLEMEAGKVCGLIGPNGAGKSTLFNAILGLVSPNAGEISFFENNSLADLRAKVAFVPQKNDLDWTFPATVFDVVMTGRYPHRRLFERMRDTDHQICTESLRKVGIESLRDRQISELSGGQQQRMFIARALAQEADIFLLDEPFVGVDATTEAKIIEILKQLAADGKTILVVHHDLSTVERYFDSVILLNQRLIAAGDVKKIFTPENIAKTFGGQLNALHQIGMLEKP